MGVFSYVPILEIDIRTQQWVQTGYIQMQERDG